MQFVKKKKMTLSNYSAFCIFGSQYLFMKSIVSFVLLLTLTLSNAQKVQDYKYIIVPPSFTSFENDQFHLGPLFKQQVKKKYYETIANEPSQWPIEMQNNPCNALIVDMEKVGNWRKNVLTVHLKNCKGEIMESFTGESKIKEFKEGFQDALKTALTTLKPYTPIQLAIIPEPKQEIPVPITQTPTTPTKSQPLEIGTEFKNANTIVLMTELKDGSFALIEKSSNTIIALLKPTSRNGVYQVTVTTASENYTTVGYFDGSTIGIEYLNSSKEFELKEFKKVQ
jgi:hypothetical protein